MKSKIKLIIFDLDGTLIDAFRPVVRSIRYTLKAVGAPLVDEETIRKTVGWGDRHLVECFVGPQKINRAIAIYRKHHQESLKVGSKLLPGAKKILNYLKRKEYAVAVASNRPSRFSRIVIDHLQMRSHFDYVLCGDQVDRPKPYPDILKKVLERFCLPASQAIYVGDMPLDIEAGNRARMKVVAVSTGESSPAVLRKKRPFRIIPRVDELRPILESF